MPLHGNPYAFHLYPAYTHQLFAISYHDPHRVFPPCPKEA